MMFYRYTTKQGRGGIVVATSESEAKKMVKSYWKHYYKEDITLQDIEVWDWNNDNYFCEEVPLVFDCY